MKPACCEKKVKAQKPLDGTLEYELCVSAPHQEIIELTEVVEEETPVGKEGASAMFEPGVYYDSQDVFNTRTAAQSLIVPDTMTPTNASFGVPESRKSSWPPSAQYVKSHSQKDAQDIGKTTNESGERELWQG